MHTQINQLAAKTYDTRPIIIDKRPIIISLSVAFLLSILVAFLLKDLEPVDQIEYVDEKSIRKRDESRPAGLPGNLVRKPADGMQKKTGPKAHRCLLCDISALGAGCEWNVSFLWEIKIHNPTTILPTLQSY